MSEKLTLKAAVIVDEVFSKTIGALVQRDMPATCAYWLSKFAKFCAAQAAELNEARVKVFQKYGKEVEGQEGAWTLTGCDPEGQKAAVEELNELFQQDIELPISRKIELPESFEITPAMLSIVDPVVTVKGIEE